MTLSQNQAHQYDPKDIQQPICEFQASFPLLRIRINQDKPWSTVKGSQLVGYRLNHPDEPVFMTVSKPLSLALIIVWRVVAPNEFSLTTISSLMSVKFSVQRFWHCYEHRLVMAVQTIPHNLIWVSSWHLFAVVQGLSSFILISTIEVTWSSNNRLLGIAWTVLMSPSSWRGPKPLWLTQFSNLWWIPHLVCIGFWACHENGLIKTSQAIPHNLYGSFKLTSLYCGLRIILVSWYIAWLEIDSQKLCS